MKKTWIVILVILGMLFTLQQRVLSRQSMLLAQSDITFCDISNYSQDSTRLYRCCINKTPPDAECAKCITSPVPTVCYPWITLTPGALDTRLTGIPNTPIPVETLPLTTITVTPDPTPTEKAVITVATYNTTDEGTGGTGGAGTNNADNVGAGDAVETKAPVPNTPIPDTPKPPKRASAPVLTNTPPPGIYYPPLPTNTPIPTPLATLTPTPALPDSLTSGTEKTKNKTTTVLDTNKIDTINIVPNAIAAEHGPTEKPLLPEEQKLLAQNSTKPGGILVTLAEKKGSEFVTRQDELTVKKGDQLYTISNQTNRPQSSSAASSELEINANNVIAHLSMGLSINPLSGILTVNTSSGPQSVSIMPDEALGIVIELRALSASGNSGQSILLVNDGGKLIYRISGEKVEKLLGLFPLAIAKQILVSADTGSVLKVELSPWSQFLSFFTC